MGYIGVITCYNSLILTFDPNFQQDILVYRETNKGQMDELDRVEEIHGRNVIYFADMLHVWSIYLHEFA